ncbi:pyridoxamine 5'-phosphate oxidase [Microbacter margulisiae]|uniref:Pyridoxine/pyridoxamine 5'-phosphate oxidase n=2 Tax=Microbacter margulisiae TaxID=1350067 RepID=A0A7W5DQY2_9PORP|nr:pyridoxamine 5'-phosphate oxidase [Microbacter margulisiae]
MMLRDIRKNYQHGILNERDMAGNPLEQFNKWLREAIDGDELEPTAMSLSTVDQHGQPHSRMVLLKEVTNEGLVFYTNYAGHKAAQIAENNHVALLFFWQSLEREVRIEGVARKVDEAISTQYFHSRPTESQLGAWASPQSQIITSHDVLDVQFRYYKEKFGDTIPKPPHWGGYIVSPVTFEFWQGRPNRLHDRLLYELIENKWIMSRLAP